MRRLQKIVSGGQTGADRAALDWAIGNGIPHGGWCPRERRAEDGIIDLRYGLVETPSRSYSQRTRWNVRDSDATLIIARRTELTGGTLATQQCAQATNKPCIHLCDELRAPALLRHFLTEFDVRVLNVAGPRESTEPGIYRFATGLLDACNAVLLANA